jgi:hypothetical protein
MVTTGKMRLHARKLRHLADQCHQTGISLSLADHRAMLLKQAEELRNQAARLEAEADALERPPVVGLATARA